jgi:hypothetical protein
MKQWLLVRPRRKTSIRGVSNNANGKSHATPARWLTSDAPRGFFGRAKYSYEKWNAKIAPPWLIFEMPM